MKLRRLEGNWYVCAKSTANLDKHESPKKKNDANTQENGESRYPALSGPCFKTKNRTTMYSGRKRGMYNNSIVII